MNDPAFAVVDSAMLLESFDEPIVIHRSFLPLAGSVNAALLLTWMITLTREQEGVGADGWLCLTQADWAAETGLSRYEQEAARKALRTRGLIEERRSGMPARLEMRVRAQVVAEALREQGRQRYGAYLDARTQFERAGQSA